MTAEQGWWRFPGHFLIWAAVPNMVGYALFAAGVSNPWLLFLRIPALLGFFLIVGLREAQSVVEGKHTFTKGLLDLASKNLGFAVGLTTAPFWWF